MHWTFMSFVPGFTFCPIFLFYIAELNWRTFVWKRSFSLCSVSCLKMATVLLFITPASGDLLSTRGPVFLLAWEGVVGDGVLESANLGLWKPNEHIFSQVCVQWLHFSSWELAMGEVFTSGLLANAQIRAFSLLKSKYGYEVLAVRSGFQVPTFFLVLWAQR